MMKKRIIMYLIVLCGLITNTGLQAKAKACPVKKTQSEAKASTKKEIIENNVLDVAQKNDELSTFVELVALAKLQDTLQTSKNITIFAPSNKAFKKLKKEHPELFENLEKAANRKRLAGILKYHMLSSKKMAKDLKDNKEFATKLTEGNGSRTRKRLTVNISGTDITMIGDEGSATIVETDMTGGNGVIQQVDDVLLPEECK